MARLTAQAARDGILFVAGLMGLFYETIIGGAERPTLIIAFVGMLGLPLFIRGDEARAAPPEPPAVEEPPAEPAPAPVPARPDRSTP